MRHAIDRPCLIPNRWCDRNAAGWNSKSGRAKGSRVRRRSVGVVVAGAILLSACAPVVEGEAAASQWEPGPLMVFTDRAWGIDRGLTREDRVAQAVTDHLRLEDLIATCMSEQGFEYLPVERDTRWDAPETSTEFGTLEHAEIYGFGITTTQRYSPTWLATEPDDPNQALLAEMTPAEREAWETAYWGSLAEGAEPGCRMRAQEEVFPHLGDDSPFAALEADVRALQDAIEADPRMQELRVQWGRCLADAGYPDIPPYPEYLYNHVSFEWNALLQDALTSPQCGWDGVGIPPESAYCAPSAAQRADFTRWEIAIAVASYRCNAATGFDAGRHEIDLELQTDFVARHRDELEAWASYEEARRG